MNTGDLRIGSIIRGIGKGPIYIVEEIRTLKVRVRYIRPDTNQEHVSIVDIENCEGIEITPELLLQLGFREYGRELTLEPDRKCYVLNCGHEVYFSRYSDWYISNFKLPHFFYLHELQNQLWILSGKDEIKWV